MHNTRKLVLFLICMIIGLLGGATFILAVLVGLTPKLPHAEYIFAFCFITGFIGMYHITVDRSDRKN